MIGVLTGSPGECLLPKGTIAISLQDDKEAAFRAVPGVAEANLRRFFSRCADNDSLKFNAASKHLRESRAHKIFARVEILADGKYQRTRVNAAAISDAFAGA
jgi:hypothetical protein